MKNLTVVLVATAATACASSIKVRSDFDPQAAAQISQYQTYAWLPHPRGGDTRVNNSIVASRIQRAVDDVFSSKGYRKTTSNPDFRVGYHAALEGKMDVSTVNSYYGYGSGRWGWGAGGVAVTQHVREYNEGTLIIDIVDGASNELVWRGSAQGEVKADVEPAKRQQRITEAVRKIFESFPPQ